MQRVQEKTVAKVYDIVKQALEDFEDCRNSDKALHFTVWNRLGYIKNRSISYLDYRKAPSTETIRRSRQKIQELHPELGPTIQRVINKRKAKEMSKGTFVYRETIETGDLA